MAKIIIVDYYIIRSPLVFGSLYFSQIPARSKSDTDKVAQ